MTHREALEREERVLYEIAEDLHLSDDETRAASVYMICGELRRIAAALASEEKPVADR